MSITTNVESNTQGTNFTNARPIESICSRIKAIRAANECAATVLFSLGLTFVAAASLNIIAAVTTLAIGAAVGYFAKESYKFLTDTGLKITHGDMTRIAAGVALAYFIPCWAGVGLLFTMFSAGTLAGRAFAPETV